MSSTQQQGIGLVENGGPGTPSRDTYDGKQRTLIRGSGVRVSPGAQQLDQRRRAAAMFLAKRFLIVGLTALVSRLFPVRRANLGNPTSALCTE